MTPAAEETEILCSFMIGYSKIYIYTHIKLLHSKSLMEVYEIKLKGLVGLFSYQNWMHSHINATTANQRTPAECKDQSKHKGILVGKKCRDCI